jgi:RimJ/RimL family protein N-acetyltransferase
MLQTSRLRLRPHRVADFEGYVPLWLPSEMQPGSGPVLALTREEAWARLLRFVGHWAHFEYGLFLVEDLSTGELLGEVGCAHFHRSMGADFDAALEGVWRVALSHRRKGIALEAMHTALGWLDQTVRIARTVCMIHPGNAASLQVAARLGYQEFSRAPYKDRTVILLERRAPQ